MRTRVGLLPLMLLSLPLRVAADQRPGGCSASPTRHAPVDTPCQAAWPNEGPVDIPVRFSDSAGIEHFYGDIKACVYYEVCSPVLDKYVDETARCCEETPTLDQGPLCAGARAKGGRSVKACKAHYLIDRQKNLDTKINPYNLSGPACCAAGHYPEWGWWCNMLTGAQDGRWFGNCGSPGGQGNGTSSPSFGFVAGMRCRDARPDPRLRPGNLQSNSCVAAGFAATHLTTEESKASGCTVDSSIMTTLLRKAGYSASEVMTVSSEYHYFVLANVPGRGFIMATGEGPEWCPKKWLECHNDSGLVPCPRKERVIGCGAQTPAPCPGGCEHDGQCQPVGAEACVNGNRLRCVGEDRVEQIGRCCPTGCLYNGKCYVPGEKECVNSEYWQCFGPEDRRRIAATCPPVRERCAEGCVYDGHCVRLWESRCVNGAVWQCEGRGQKRRIGLCCPGGCLYNARCYRPGQTECVDGNLWQCFGEENRGRIGTCPNRSS